MCIRYMPKVSLLMRVIQAGASWMQEKSRNAPNVVMRTLSVQNSHDHSAIGVSSICPGTPFHQKLHAVNAAPRRKHRLPTLMRFERDQSRCTRM